jgi:spore germination protein D
MKAKWVRLVPALAMVCLVTACGSDTQASTTNGAGGYKETKSMVLDILKTEDGIKAIQDANTRNNTKIQMLSAGDTRQLQLAVKDVLVDTNSTKFLNNMITDPLFAGQFAKAIQKETKQLQKDLMKDPEYQVQLLNAMKGAEFQAMLLDTMKSPQYKQQIQTAIQESLQSPLFRVEMMNLMKKVLENESKPQAMQSGQGGGQGGGGQSGQGGGQGGQSGEGQGGGGGGSSGGGQSGGGQGGGSSGGDSGGSESGGDSSGEDKKKKESS